MLDLITKEDTKGYEGPIKENGDINWQCPCMAGMVSGPCGWEFRQAFSCFHYRCALFLIKGDLCRELVDVSNF